MTISPGEIKTAHMHGLLLASISPRPICFASTIDANGNPNLSPFSFFNIFGSNPVTLIFSPARRVRDNSIKHTLENAIATKEVVINVVNYAMVQQMSLASCEYPAGTNEFTKSGFTMLESEVVKPFRVAESPVQLECIVKQVIETGQEGGAGNLVICEMVKLHINDAVLDGDGTIDPHKIDLVARMGGDYYCRASGDAVFVVPKPNVQLGIGFDGLPEAVLKSTILSANDLGKLANIAILPEVSEDLTGFTEIERHQKAKDLLAADDVANAWKWLLI